MSETDSSRATIEKAVLSCLLRDSALLAHATPTLTPNQFHDPLHALIYSALVCHSQSGHLPDLPTIVREVGSSSLIDEAEAAMVIAELLVFTPHTMHGGYYLSLLTDPDE